MFTCAQTPGADSAYTMLHAYIFGHIYVCIFFKYILLSPYFLWVWQEFLEMFRVVKVLNAYTLY